MTTLQIIHGQLEEAAYRITDNFCYTCYKVIDGDRCPTCGSDDFMRHCPSVPSFGLSTETHPQTTRGKKAEAAKRHKPFCRGCSKFWNTNHPKTSFSARNQRVFQCSKSFILFSLCVLYTPLPPPFTFYSSIKSFLLKNMEHWNKRSYRLRQGGFLFQKWVLFLEHLWNSS